MSDFLLLFVIVLFALIPPALILLGILLRKEKYGVYLFLVGWFCISTILIPFISEFFEKIICYILNLFGITASFHNNSFVFASLTILSFLASIKVFDLLSSPRKKNEKNHRTPPSNAVTSSSPKNDEAFYYLESSDRFLVRVPESKLEFWKQAQSSKESHQLTKEEQLLKERILQDIYGD